MTKLSAPLDVEDRQWTAGVALPGGNFSVEDVQRLIDGLQTTYSFLSPKWARRLIRAYGTNAMMLAGDREKSGRDLGHGHLGRAHGECRSLDGFVQLPQVVDYPDGPVLLDHVMDV